MKVYQKSCSFNICSSFSAGSIYEGAKSTLQYMPNKNLQQPKSFIAHVWHFQWRKFEAHYLDNIYVSTSRFFMMYWDLCAQKYYYINIGDSYMRLFLGQSNTIVYIYSKTKYRSGQRICISNWIQVYVLSKLRRYMYERQNFERKKGMRVSGQSYENIEYCRGGINKPFIFNSVKRRRPQCIGKIRALLWNFMADIASLPVNAKWQQI